MKNWTNLSETDNGQQKSGRTQTQEKRLKNSNKKWDKNIRMQVGS